MLKNSNFVDVYKDGKWEPSKFTDLKTGDVFRMFEDEGRTTPIIVIGGCSIFKAVSSPHIIESRPTSNITVECFKSLEEINKA